MQAFYHGLLMTDNHLSIDERLKKYPHLRNRFETILNITESKGNGPDTADAVEERAILELRKLGQEVMQEWAENKMNQEIADYRAKHSQAHIHKKKQPTGRLPLEQSKSRKLS